MWFKLSFLFSSFLRKVFLRLPRFFFHRQKPANSNLIRNGQTLVTFLHSKISLGFFCVNNLGLRCVIVAIVKFGFVCWSSNILLIPKWPFSHWRQITYLRRTYSVWFQQISIPPRRAMEIPRGGGPKGSNSRGGRGLLT